MIIRNLDDIYEYENKVWGNFSSRMLICFLIAIAVAALVFAGLFLPTGSVDLASTVAGICCLPVMWFGIYKKDGQHLEQILKYKYLAKFKYTRKRKFVMTNLYEIIENNQKEWKTANEQLENAIAQEGQKTNHKKLFPLGKKGHRTK
ncbi:PrgI family protein [Faecalispora jeddahensis]|uniref:PrgI family protein n=1 Tax=Faecalispora jeddahensis TaxID=1414721 RepID=UPI0005A82E05|nr:PrgI family protein [Faecalispora jeddahensis]